ncbi:RDD family protein [Herbiconiux sp. L3-i23]|uniref:RDD family protein n=1 Tax=Herbiconiux sp. L3-i23 TaxID=2905871 RepID=UPI00205B099D|nr:RDD family protein [Herbiconiux sp. L3-i23]BDI22901.1 RDD family protein [Herbiconiux sp. L3-i23]
MSAASASASPGRYPGERLGLPESGPGSIARPGRRIGAILIDFALCYVVYAAFFFGSNWASLAIFAVEQIVLVTLLGGGVGHLLLGMRVIRLHGGWAGWWRPAVRTALLCLLIPAVIWDADQRGLHDVFADTLLVRTR